MKKRLSFLAILSFLFVTDQAQAVALFPGETTSGYREYISAFYNFSIPVGLLIATVLIMIGGVIWITSAGNQQRIAKAQEFIIQPIIGVIILAGAYVLLGFINPNLVDLRLRIQTLQNIETGSCQLVAPSTYENQVASTKRLRCLQGCKTATSQKQCDELAKTNKSDVSIYQGSTSCNSLCNFNSVEVACADIPVKTNVRTVSDCNKHCIETHGKNKPESEKNTTCYAQSFTNGNCQCGGSSPLEPTPEQQVIEDAVRVQRQQALDRVENQDPFFSRRRTCQTTTTVTAPSFTLVGVSQICSDYCSGVDSSCEFSSTECIEEGQQPDDDILCDEARCFCLFVDPE